jgi:hypothetical protein
VTVSYVPNTVDNKMSKLSIIIEFVECDFGMSLRSSINIKINN